MAGGHGGVRPGAGRPSTGRRRVVLQLTEAEEKAVRQFVAEMREIQNFGKSKKSE